MDCNRRRQENELKAISNIYDANEFSYIKEDAVQCYYNIFPNVSDGTLTFKNAPQEDNKLKSSSNNFINYLPPVRVYLNFCNNYPTKNPPNFYIIASWLSPWQISFICQKLDEIWSNNEGQEILFLWFEFLKHDLLNFLRIKDTLDVSFLCTVYNNLSDYFRLNLTFTYDARAVHSTLFSNPIQYLIDYNKEKCIIEFEKNYHTCIICFEEYKGKNCTKLQNCSHVYCKNCIQKYVAVTINGNIITDIKCPALCCTFSITMDEIKDLCPNLFSKYESSLLQITLRSMNDIIFCPQISCQCPLITYNDTLAICSNCDHAFCRYCYKVYHGIEPCAMTSDYTKKLIEDYKNANKYQKQLLIKKHGIQSIQRVVENYLTKEYLQKNVKPCPNCQTMIVKIDGCNKMTCIHCKAHFCWLCGTHITTLDAYQHFWRGENSCYRRLFETSIADDSQQ
ncbi:E3 ubiquitin-protein ligase RNF14-like [Colletes gigas]|uniref:E3 ubiquitin-protein ligase RNF14-like n=1 Tax=Colletes gigas TaxID=935657 RepID=UPI001C9A68E6|nr:E3 ubiquitin-protein ligase RNF14-like [Colletes gigas]